MTRQVPKPKTLIDKKLDEMDSPGPGPGAYESQDVTRTGKKLDMLSAPQSHHSAFKAQPHKLVLSGNLDSPAPTKYTLVSVLGWQSLAG